MKHKISIVFKNISNETFLLLNIIDDHLYQQKKRRNIALNVGNMFYKNKN